MSHHEYHQDKLINKGTRTMGVREDVQAGIVNQEMLFLPRETIVRVCIKNSKVE